MNDIHRCLGRRAVATSALVAAALFVFSEDAPGQGIPERMPSARSMMDWGRVSFILFDELEYVPGDEGRPVTFEGLGWYGGAYNRLWFRTEGEQNTAGGGGAGEVELLFGRLVSRYWDAIVGLRYDQRWDERNDRRILFAAGMLGQAPLRFEFAPTLFISTDGDISARLDASYQFLLTQRLILEPSIDLNAAARAVPEFGVGTGLNEAVLATRMRYEIRRKFGPYVGVAWTKKIGSTADLARAEGRDASGVNLVFGLRVWR